MPKKIFLSSLFAIAAGGTIAIFQLVERPFLWIFVLWTCVGVCAALGSASTIIKTILINLAAVFFTLGIYEGYLLHQQSNDDPTRMQGNYNVDYFAGDDLLGYGPAKGKISTAEKYYQDELIYSVRYTISNEGLRASPPVKPSPVGCVLFFGGSVTFGEGVEDEQAMPYQVGVLTGHDYQVYNFAFHGYGPHQMLAALQRDRVDQVIGCLPTHIIYQAIIPHVERAAGRAIWDKQGPRYILKSDAGVELAGRFDDEDFNPLWKRLNGRWLTYDKLFGRHRAASSDEIQLFVEIIDSARKLTEARYPGAEFHLLIWDNDGLVSHDAVMKALQETDLRLHRISTILPDYREDKSLYELHLHDHHPSAATHAEIARYVVRQVLHYEPEFVPIESK